MQDVDIPPRTVGGPTQQADLGPDCGRCVVLCAVLFCLMLRVTRPRNGVGNGQTACFRLVHFAPWMRNTAGLFGDSGDGGSLREQQGLTDEAGGSVAASATQSFLHGTRLLVVES